MRFIHIADVHLGATPDKGKPWSGARAEEIWRSFRRVLGVARQEEIDLLLIAGDLFHRQPLTRELKEINYLFSRLENTRVVWIAGNHDYLKKDGDYSDFPWGENVTFLREPRCEQVHFPDLDTTVYGLSYHAREINQPLYDDLEPESEEGCHILLAHGGDGKHIPIDRRRLLARSFDYIALGHIHKPEYLEEDRAAYAGSLEPLDVNETGAHGFILGEYYRGKMSTEFVPFACREYIHLEINSSRDSRDVSMEEQISQAIGQLGSQHIYRVVIRGFRDPDIRFRTERYLSQGNIIDVIDESQPDYDFEALRRLHGDDVVGRYIDRLWKPEDGGAGAGIREKALYYGIQAMLQE